ncbi:MAG: periplasmic heavy metal sensor [Acidobacteriota bacterium]|nr:periplasmic heavy metal sensor [Acidobacteriota bacterium]
MKKLKLFNIILAGLFLTLTFTVVKAQNDRQGDAPKPQFNEPRRLNLLQELALVQEQKQQLRRLNADRKPLMREAQIRLREANRNLDRAIYADNVDETEIQARIKELQLAQAEVIKIRSLTELEVRKILTPEQLVKFREIRRQFAERLENRQNQQKNRMNDKGLKRRVSGRQNTLRPNN